MTQRFVYSTFVKVITYGLSLTLAFIFGWLWVVERDFSLSITLPAILLVLLLIPYILGDRRLLLGTKVV